MKGNGEQRTGNRETKPPTRGGVSTVRLTLTAKPSSGYFIFLNLVVFFLADLLIPHSLRATSINDLRVPPGNRLEKLVGDRKGQYSIRINDQWRICFVWTDENNASEVEIVDYH